MSYTASYWEKDSLLKSYDVIIVGAGIVGLMSALFYKQEHPAARVTVIERGFLPKGASTRNAGFACVGSISEHIADTDLESESNIKKRIKRRHEGLKLLRKTLGDKAIGYEACGGRELFTSQEAFENSASQIERFNGWMSDLLGEEDVYKTDTLNGYPVIYNRLEGALHPGRMMQELIHRIGLQGVEVKWNSSVEDISPAGVITLSGGQQLEAKKILIAANGFVKRLLPDLEIKPARGYVFVTNEIPEMPWKGIFHHDNGYIYFRNINDRLLIGGARNLAVDEETTDQFGTNQQIKDHLVHFVDEVLELPGSWQIEHEWSGIMGFTSTKTPIVKQLDKHRFVASGLSGMGIAIGSEIGRKAVALLNSKSE